MSKHTETPWEQFDTGLCFAVVSQKKVNKRIAECKYPVMQKVRGGLPVMTDEQSPGQANANAEFIVRACNSHDELLEACKEVVAQEDRKTGQNYLIHQQTMEKLKQIIQKAEGK